jgi:dipeptidyl-peptidase-4
LLSIQVDIVLFRNLGTVEMEDQIAVSRKLLERYSYLDATRTAIWGWSYGGFATLMTLEQDVGPSPVFSCGISGIFTFLNF